MKKLILISLSIFSLVSCRKENDKTEYKQTTYCNPLNLDYGWGKFSEKRKESRTSADPVIVLFKDKYYLFTTQDIGGYRVSDDLMTWKNIYFDKSIDPSPLDVDHYVAPAVAADGNYMYFINFNRKREQQTTNVFRTSDPESGIWEKCGEVRRMADPSLFIDNGRYHIYYGLGVDQSTKYYEVDSVTFIEKPNSLKVLREYITDVNDCKSGYHFGRREIYDEIEAPEWKGKFNYLPCPEGAWIVKNNNKYYLQYATPGTICNWYCDIVMVSDSVNGGFVEMPYNPVSLKVGGFIGGAGHSSVFKDKYGNWWEATTMWIGNHDEFERRIALFPVSFDNEGRMKVHTVLGDYPISMPNKKIDSFDSNPTMGWMIQSYNKECSASSVLKGFETKNASDENVRTWWSAKSGNTGEWFMMNLGKRTTINAIQVNFADQDADLTASEDAEFHAYKLYASDDAKDWTLIADNSNNKTIVLHDYIELAKPINANYIKIENIHTPRNGKFALLDLRIFGSGHSALPDAVKIKSVERDQNDKRYALLSWQPVENADGYLVRFGYQPDFLNLCIQVKDKEKASLLIHILTKGIKYYYRVDSYNDTGITEGIITND